MILNRRAISLLKNLREARNDMRSIQCNTVFSDDYVEGYLTAIRQIFALDYEWTKSIDKIIEQLEAID